LDLSNIEVANRLGKTVGTAPTRSEESVARAGASDPSPAEEAWALLRDLLFAERRRFFQAASELDLHPAQAGALLQLDEQSGLPMHELATRLACDNSNITGIVDRLEARGLVARRPSEHDRRVKYIVPTPLGLELRAAMHARIAQVPGAIERLSVSDQRLLRDVLARAARPGTVAT
jgi:MarR family transcriptional regulator, organic hydroperoxide resistance regulator